MRWQGRRESENVEDRRDEGGGMMTVAAGVSVFLFQAEAAADFRSRWARVAAALASSA